MNTSPLAPTRAPALYVTGTFERGQDGEVLPVAFRLPLPPAWDDRRPAAWAAERRARRAYFATLDALHTGSVDPVEEAKIGRLHDDIRSNIARRAVRHLQRVLDHVRGDAGRPSLPHPPSPLKTVVITAPPPTSTSTRDPASTPASPPLPELAARYRWALEWLEARRYVAAGKELRLEWRLAES